MDGHSGFLRPNSASMQMNIGIASKYLLKPIEYENLVQTIRGAYETKVQMQNAKFREEVENIYRSGMGARGIKNAMNKLRKIYGIE